MQDMRRSAEACGDPSSSRAYWITRQDLNNMAASVGVSITGDSAKSKNEVISVAIYAEEIQSSEQVSCPVTPRQPRYSFLVSFYSFLF